MKLRLLFLIIGLAGTLAADPQSAVYTNSDGTIKTPSNFFPANSVRPLPAPAGHAGTVAGSDGTNYVLLTASQVQTLLGLDTAAYQPLTAFDAAGTAAAAQAASLQKTSNLGDVSNAATARANLGLAIGINVQAYSATLDAWAAKTPYAGSLVISSGKTGTFLNTLTLQGTDGSVLNVGAGGTLGTAAFSALASPAGASSDTSPATAATPAGVLVKTTKIIYPRFGELLRLMQDALQAGTGLTGVALGHSIVEGSGASIPANSWVSLLGSQLTTWAGAGTWTITNYGIGGTTICEPAAFLAHNGDTTANGISRGTVINGKPAFALIMGLRNSTPVSGGVTYSLTDYCDILRATLRQARRNNIDVIFVTEPPMFNTSDGSILDTDSNFGKYRLAALRICSEEGASVVDNWLYFYNLKTAGVNVYTTYMAADGVHPNDAGHAVIAANVFTCMTGSSERLPFAAETSVGTNRNYLASAYVATSSSVSSVSGAFDPSPRQVQTGEGAGLAYNMASAATLQFTSPIPANGIIVTVYGGAATTGSIQVDYAFQGTSSVGTITPSDPFTRVHSYYLPIAAGTSGTQANSLSTFKLTASGGPVALCGITVLGHESTEYLPRWVNAVETGSGWSDSTLASGVGCRADAVVGDSATVTWYGTAMTINYTIGTSYGKFTWQTDGGSTTTVDTYSSAADSLGGFNQQALTEGWHSTVFTVATKNASSSANTVKIGRLRIFSSTPMPQSRFVSARAGDVILLPDYWRLARIVRVISGAPVTEQFVAGSSSLVVGGSGSGVIELSR